MKNKISWLFCCLGLMLLSPLVSAKEIQMYDQPSNNAKAIGKIDLSVGIIPIYIHPQKQWVRVGDPRNGNVGWVKVNEVNNNDGTEVTVTQKIINDGKGPYNYQSVEIGKPARVSQEEIQAQMREWQKQQQNIQQIQQQVYQNLLNKIHELNDPTGARYEMINEIGNSIPKMFPLFNQPVQKPSIEKTEPVAGTPATQPTPGMPSTEPTSGTKPVGPSRN